MTVNKISLTTHRLSDDTILQSEEKNRPLLPGLFISHGAPTLAIEKSSTTNALAKIGQNLPLPKAIVIMSAHWQSSELEINSNPKPSTWHDFSGFPKQMYQIEYPAKGHSELAESLSHQLNQGGVKTKLNPLRAFDHGVWTPLIHMYPHANIPIIQISLPYHFDAHTCFQLGAMFQSLRKEQILMIGSGNITHNLKRMQWQSDTKDKQATSFKFWLLNQLKHDIPQALSWKDFEDYQAVHPSDEHLLPLFWVLGTGQRVSVIHESMAHHSIGMDIYRFD